MLETLALLQAASAALPLVALPLEASPRQAQPDSADPAAAVEPEPDTTPRITSVALFKNGLAWIHSEVTLPGAEPVVIGLAPEAVHGTFAVDAPVPVEARTVPFDVSVPFDEVWEDDPRVAFAGLRVRARMHGEDEPLVGRVVDTSRARARDWDRNYTDSLRAGSAGLTPWQTTSRNGTLLCLEEDTPDGTVRHFVRLAAIQSISVIDPPASCQRSGTGLELTAPGAAGAARATVTYLAKGLSYAPNYRIDLKGDGTLGLSQAAVIRNEFGPLEDVEVQLVSGLPNVPYAEVLSPLAEGQGWAAFFSAVERWAGRPTENALFGQAALRSTSSHPGPVADAGLGAGDLEYRSLGRRSLGEGESLYVDVASARADFERMVEWTIDDTRSEAEWRRHSAAFSWSWSGWDRNRTAQEEARAPWDVVRFRNPLPFALTTAPATVVEGDRFLGERQLDWVPSGGEVVVRVSRALAIDATVVETDSAVQIVDEGGGARRSKSVEGELRLANGRGVAVTVEVKRPIFGALEWASEAPRTEAAAVAPGEVNPRTEAVWRIELAPGEARTLRYRVRVDL